MARRKIRDEQDARECLYAASHSGVSRRQWARDHGIDGRSLNAWGLNLARREQGCAPSRGLRLVELVPAVAAPVAGSPLVVQCGPGSIEVPADFDDDHLGRVLRVLTSC